MYKKCSSTIDPFLPVMLLTRHPQNTDCTNHGIFNTRNVACILTAYSEGFVSSNDPPYNKTASVTRECSLPLSRRHGVVRVALGREGGREGTQL